MKTLTLLLLSASMLRAQCAGCSSVGGGGGASATYQLTDGLVTLSGNTLTVGAGCAVSTPCNIPLGGGQALTTSATVASPVGNGTALIYVTNTGTYEVGLPASGLTVTCTGCTPRVGTTAQPLDTLLLYTWTAASSAWNASGGTNRRIFWSAPQKQFVAGSVFAEDATKITIPTGASTAADYTFNGLVGPVTAGARSSAVSITACAGVTCRCDLQALLPASGNGSGTGRVEVNWTHSAEAGSKLLTTGMSAITIAQSANAILKSQAATTPTWLVLAVTTDNSFLVDIACYIVH